MSADNPLWRTAFKIPTSILILLLPVLFLVQCEQPDEDISFDPADSLVVTLNANAETLSLLNLNSGELLRDVVGTGRIPNDMLFLRDTLYLLNSDQQSISIYAMTPVPVYLRAIELGDDAVNLNIFNLATDGAWLWVTCFLQDRVLRVDPVSGQQESFRVGSAPEGVICHNGQVLVTNTNYLFSDFTWGEGSVSVLDGASGDSVTTIPVDINPQRLLLSPAGNIAVMCTGDYSGNGVILELDPANWNVIQRREVQCAPLNALFQENRLLLAAGGWDGQEEFSGIVCLQDWSSGEWIFGPENPLRTHRGAMGLLPLESGFLVACFGSGRVDRFDEAGNLIDFWEVGDGVQMLLHLP